jgi:3-phenylpropionate/trans-cinnamate dioxygenase ferredoxin reductase subunit
LVPITNPVDAAGGRATVYDKVPYFFSDQYDLGMEYTGFAPNWDEVVFRANPSEGEFIALWLHQGRVVAGMNASVWDVAKAIEALVRAGLAVDRARLVDPEVDLSSLVAPPG